MAEIKVYSTGCPRCKILEEKLESAKIEYDKIEDINEIQRLGIMSVPVMKVREKLLQFGDAVRYINENF